MLALELRELDTRQKTFPTVIARDESGFAGGQEQCVISPDSSDTESHACGCRETDLKRALDSKVAPVVADGSHSAALILDEMKLVADDELGERSDPGATEHGARCRPQHKFARRSVPVDRKDSGVARTA